MKPTMDSRYKAEADTLAWDLRGQVAETSRSVWDWEGMIISVAEVEVGNYLPTRQQS